MCSTRVKVFVFYFVVKKDLGQQLGTTDSGLTNRTPQESAQTGRERSSNIWKERPKEEKSKKKDTGVVIEALQGFPNFKPGYIQPLQFSSLYETYERSVIDLELLIFLN